MTKAELIDKMQRYEAWVPGKRVKLDFGNDGIVLVDGVGCVVSDVDGPADAAVGVSWADWQALSDRRLEPMSAYMMGKLRVSGDTGAAMQLGTLLAKLKG
ncbi:MAG: SCP2 sterol-binding domain-containing protein [Sphingomicrobium sp.]